MNDLAELNADYLKTLSIRQKMKNKGKTIPCPYPIMNYSLATGLSSVEKLDCQFGPGKWCSICPHKKRYMYQQRFSNKSYASHKEHIALETNKRGLLPQFWNSGKKGVEHKLVRS